MDVEAEILKLNERARATFGEPLIDIFVGRSPEGESTLNFSLVGVQSPNIQNGILFDFHPTGNGIYYRNRYIGLSPEKMKILRTVFDAPQRLSTYTDLQKIMGWTASTPSTPALRHMREINEITLKATGATLLNAVSRVGLQLHAIPPPTLPSHGTIIKTDKGPLFLDVEPLHMFNQLQLWRFPYRSSIKLEPEYLDALGLSEEELVAALSKINREFERAAEQPLVEGLVLGYHRDREVALTWRRNAFLKRVSHRREFFSGLLTLGGNSNLLCKEALSPKAKIPQPDWQILK